jgi:hypothetical protein
MPDEPEVEQPSEASDEEAVEVAREEKPPRVRKARTSIDWRALTRDNARLLLVVAMLIAGIVLVMLGWYGAAHTNILTEQIPYLISGGLLGLGLIIVAGVMISGAAQERANADLRAEIAQAIAAIRTGMPDREFRASDVSSNGHHVYVVPGGRSYHEAGCPILEGKEGVKELQPAQASSSGYAPCKLCGLE